MGPDGAKQGHGALPLQRPNSPWNVSTSGGALARAVARLTGGLAQLAMVDVPERRRSAQLR